MSSNEVFLKLTFIKLQSLKLIFFKLLFSNIILEKVILQEISTFFSSLSFNKYGIKTPTLDWIYEGRHSLVTKLTSAST